MLDDVRFQVARELLASDIALDDIAATLGYSTVTPFMRTFRRWSGTTPGRWRGMVRGNQAFRFNRCAPTLPRAIELLTPHHGQLIRFTLEWLRIATGRASSGLSRCQSNAVTCHA